MWQLWITLYLLEEVGFFGCESSTTNNDLFSIDHMVKHGSDIAGYPRWRAHFSPLDTPTHTTKASMDGSCVLTKTWKGNVFPGYANINNHCLLNQYCSNCSEFSNACNHELLWSKNEKRSSLVSNNTAKSKHISIKVELQFCFDILLYFLYKDPRLKNSESKNAVRGSLPLRVRDWSRKRTWRTRAVTKCPNLFIRWMPIGIPNSKKCNAPLINCGNTTTTKSRLFSGKNNTETLDPVDESKVKTTIGLEIHVQLQAKLKGFCSCLAETPSLTSFSRPAGDIRKSNGLSAQRFPSQQPFAHSGMNLNTCPICLGLPGPVPVLNPEVIELAYKACKALNAKIADSIEFDRKYYSCGDLPKGYQITQQRLPIGTGGYVMVPAGDIIHKKIPLRRVHVEEDTGRTLEDPVSGTKVYDFNRAGIPLIEIVTEPWRATSKEAANLFAEVRKILLLSGVCKGNLEDGNIRCDVNVNVETDTHISDRIELKNMGSYKSMEDAIKYETKRLQACMRPKQAQYFPKRDSESSPEQLADPHIVHDQITVETRSWDARERRSMISRVKPVKYRFSKEFLIPALPIRQMKLAAYDGAQNDTIFSRRKKYLTTYKLDPKTCESLLSFPETIEYFEKCIQLGGDPVLVSNWIVNDIFRWLSKKGWKYNNIKKLLLTPEKLIVLLSMISDEVISSHMARMFFPELCDKWDGTAQDFVDKDSVAVIKDPKIIERFALDVLNEKPDAIAKYLRGNSRLLQYFVGETLKKSKNRASPSIVQAVIQRLLASAQGHILELSDQMTMYETSEENQSHRESSE